MSPSQIKATHQHGAVLFLSLIFLVLISILALTATSTSIMQERMVGGLRNRQLGLMGAETALRGGEEFLWNLNFNGNQQPLPPCIGNSTGLDCLYQPQPSGLLDPTVQAFRSSTEWISPASDGGKPYARDLTSLTGDSITANIATQPRYLIEWLGVNRPPSLGATGGGKYPVGGPARPGESHFYRITGRSQGGTDAVIRVSESYYTALNLSTTGYNPGAANPPPPPPAP
ncbi:MAG: PilX N-terminal domain-containing pilus assembly protein [Lysobacterales bacterium]